MSALLGVERTLDNGPSLVEGRGHGHLRHVDPERVIRIPVLEELTREIKAVALELQSNVANELNALAVVSLRMRE
jgi:hypothetical protein